MGDAPWVAYTLVLRETPEMLAALRVAKETRVRVSFLTREMQALRSLWDVSQQRGLDDLTVTLLGAAREATDDLTEAMCTVVRQGRAWPLPTS